MVLASGNRACPASTARRPSPFGALHMTASLTLRASVVSVGLFLAFVLVWHLATRGSGPVAQMDPEYAKLMGAAATQGKSAMPGPLDVAAKIFDHLQRPFYDNGRTTRASASSSPFRLRGSRPATCSPSR